MSEKSEALRLADALEVVSVFGPLNAMRLEDAAAELRRLVAENEALRRERDEARRTVRETHEAGTRLTAQRDALLEALKDVMDRLVDRHETDEAAVAARAAIKAVEGENHAKNL